LVDRRQVFRHAIALLHDLLVPLPKNLDQLLGLTTGTLKLMMPISCHGLLGLGFPSLPDQSSVVVDRVLHARRQLDQTLFCIRD
jgi:hypothetical protein